MSNILAEDGKRNSSGEYGSYDTGFDGYGIPIIQHSYHASFESTFSISTTVSLSYPPLSLAH